MYNNNMMCGRVVIKFNKCNKMVLTNELALEINFLSFPCSTSLKVSKTGEFSPKIFFLKAQLWIRQSQDLISHQSKPLS